MKPVSSPPNFDRPRVPPKTVRRRLIALICVALVVYLLLLLLNEFQERQRHQSTNEVNEDRGTDADGQTVPDFVLQATKEAIKNRNGLFSKNCSMFDAASGEYRNVTLAVPLAIMKSISGPRTTTT